MQFEGVLGWVGYGMGMGIEMLHACVSDSIGIVVVLSCLVRGFVMIYTCFSSLHSIWICCVFLPCW